MYVFCHCPLDIFHFLEKIKFVVHCLILECFCRTKNFKAKYFFVLAALLMDGNVLVLNTNICVAYISVHY